MDEYQRFVWNDKRYQEFTKRAFRPPPTLPHDEQSLKTFIDWLLEPPDFRLFAYRSDIHEFEPTSLIEILLRTRPSTLFCDRLLESTPRQFQDLVADFFRRLGGQVVNGKNGPDGGIDALWKTPCADYIIQCKRKRGKTGEPVIREIFGLAAKNTVRGAFIVAIGGFSENATGFAEGLKPQIGFINGEEFFKLLSLVMPTVAQEIQTRTPRKK